jgi:transcriptional regulator with XRE-family HTH domain
MPYIHHKIRILRLEKQYTQEYIAEQLKMSLRTYQNMEAGKSPITLDRLRDISLIYGLSLDDVAQDLEPGSVTLLPNLEVSDAIQVLEDRLQVLEERFQRIERLLESAMQEKT